MGRTMPMKNSTQRWSVRQMAALALLGCLAVALASSGGTADEANKSPEAKPAADTPKKTPDVKPAADTTKNSTDVKPAANDDKKSPDAKPAGGAEKKAPDAKPADDVKLAADDDTGKGPSEHDLRVLGYTRP